ncbi:MAG: flagellar hook-length control protein FliK, partial [Roseococcus sp.]
DAAPLSKPATTPPGLRSEPVSPEPQPIEPVVESPPEAGPLPQTPHPSTAPEPRPAAALPPATAVPGNPPPTPNHDWTLEPTAPTPRPVEAPAAAPPAPPVPMRQVAPIAIALAFSPGMANGFQLSLDPVELGRVEIRVQREGESHSVRVTAERPETLALLLRDRQELDRSLADAGLRVESKGIDFALSPQSGGTDQRPQGEARPGPTRRATRSGTGQQEAEAPPARLARGLLDLNI